MVDSFVFFINVFCVFVCVWKQTNGEGRKKEKGRRKENKRDVEVVVDPLIRFADICFYVVGSENSSMYHRESSIEKKEVVAVVVVVVVVVVVLVMLVDGGEWDASSTTLM